MKIATSLLAAVLLVGALGAINTAMAADGIIDKQELTPGSYCHLKFPAIREDTLGTDHPTLEDPNSGDIIDFYGSCDENPVGKHQVEEQKLEELQQWFRD
jgi:hypothetical protein